MHQASSNLCKLIINVAWTKVKIWDITRKKHEGKGYITITKMELIEEAYKTIVLSSQALFKSDLKMGFHTKTIEGIQVLLLGCCSL